MILDKAMRRIHDALAKGMMDKKLLVKGGWALYRAQVVPHNASELQLRETRQAFYAGAQHILACVMVGLDSGAEPTDDDLKRMDYLHDELEEGVIRFTYQESDTKPSGDRPSLEITREMVAAGLAAFEGARGAFSDEAIVREVYTAMSRVAGEDSRGASV